MKYIICSTTCSNENYGCCRFACVAVTSDFIQFIRERCDLLHSVSTSFDLVSMRFTGHHACFYSNPLGDVSLNMDYTITDDASVMEQSEAEKMKWCHTVISHSGIHWEACPIESDVVITTKNICWDNVTGCYIDEEALQRWCARRNLAY